MHPPAPVQAQPPFSFSYVRSQESNARLGVLRTPHGAIETPAFIFCATKAALKGISIADMEELDTQIILSNTYHLMLKPGADFIEKKGGLHNFIGWKKPMLTDSGGFQIFSLGVGEHMEELKRRYSHPGVSSGGVRFISEEGVECRSYYDGSRWFLTPESSIQLQCKFGADLIVVLDECTPFSRDFLFTRDSVTLNHAWADRSLKEFSLHDNGTQALYGIIHGGVFKDLRKLSADFNNDRPFFGLAIGGSLGQNMEDMQNVVFWSMMYADPSRPVHLLGVGHVRDIFMGVRHGIDTFDCVHPTRIARHGSALVKMRYNNVNHREHINLRNACFKEDDTPIEPDCTCKVCQKHSRSYLHYLLRANEPMVYGLLTYHNVHFMNQLMKRIREVLRTNGSLTALESEYIYA